MTKILAIGNSFSQDATHYLQQIAGADGLAWKVANLYIGGCSLQQHWENIQSDAKAYLYEENGMSTETYVSVREALEMEEWDYIVTQQASHDSGIAESYWPYLEEVAAYVRSKAPRAELLLHETWAYESDSLHSSYHKYGYDQKEMYEKLSAAYRAAASRLGVRLIPSGDVIQALRARPPFDYGHGGMSLCRDGFHMNIIYGRYLLSAVWYKTLTGNPILKNTYVPSTPLSPKAICDEKVLKVVKAAVDELVK